MWSPSPVCKVCSLLALPPGIKESSGSTGNSREHTVLGTGSLHLRYSLLPASVAPRALAPRRLYPASSLAVSSHLFTGHRDVRPWDHPSSGGWSGCSDPCWGRRAKHWRLWPPRGSQSGGPAEALGVKLLVKLAQTTQTPPWRQLVRGHCSHLSPFPCSPGEPWIPGARWL